MFEKVLVAIDFSKGSQKILDHIDEIPGIREVVLLHVVDATHPSMHGWTHGPHIENAKIQLAEKKADLENPGSKVRISVDVLVKIITGGSVSRTILETANLHQVSLIIIGARGINPIQELLLGSVSSEVIRHANTHVLVMRCPQDGGDAGTPQCSSLRQLFANILVPTDFSPSADDAYSFVKTIPGIKKIVLLHVIHRGESQDEIEGFVKEAQERFENLKDTFAYTAVEVKQHIRVGDPTEMILTIAQEEDISLIAMSAYGTGWIREMLLGSTTFTVVRRTKKPVLIIRTVQDQDPD